MLGAALAYANGADPLAGGSAAVAAERAAEYLAKQYDDGHRAGQKFRQALKRRSRWR